jgi:tRNA threonylcarbamoyl adenosine modification protein (Sua5/YciO/YrdC/YwlC family)
MGEHLYTHIDPPNERDLKRVSTILDAGGVVALPAGTTWMFCCDAASKKGVAQIRLLKPMHPKEKPFSLICSSISMASQMARIDNHAYRSLSRICPGHFTILFKSTKFVPKLLGNKRATVGIRIPNEPLTLALVEHYGKPLIATSVPDDEEGLAMTMGYAIQDVYGHGLDMVLDLGEELIGQETTILDFTSGEAEVVRQGAGELADL